MEGVLTFQNITFIIAILGTAFGIYHFFRNPDISNDKAICILQGELENAKEISALMVKTMQNDIHSLGVKIDNLGMEIKNQALVVKALETIIEERIPKKMI